MENFWNLYKKGDYTDFTLCINNDKFNIHKKIVKGKGSMMIDNLIENNFNMNFLLTHNEEFIEKNIIEDIIHYIYDNNFVIETHINSCESLKKFKKAINFFELNYSLKDFEIVFNAIPEDCVAFTFSFIEIKNIISFLTQNTQDEHNKYIIFATDDNNLNISLRTHVTPKNITVNFKPINKNNVNISSIKFYIETNTLIHITDVFKLSRNNFVMLSFNNVIFQSLSVANDSEDIPLISSQYKKFPAINDYKCIYNKTNKTIKIKEILNNNNVEKKITHNGKIFDIGEILEYNLIPSAIYSGKTDNYIFATHIDSRITYSFAIKSNDTKNKNVKLDVGKLGNAQLVEKMLDSINNTSFPEYSSTNPIKEAGLNILKDIKIEIGKSKIDKNCDDWMKIWSELHDNNTIENVGTDCTYSDIWGPDKQDDDMIEDVDTDCTDTDSDSDSDSDNGNNVDNNTVNCDIVTTIKPGTYDAYADNFVTPNHKVEIKGDCQVEGNLNVQGNLTVSKNINVGGSLITVEHKVIHEAEETSIPKKALEGKELYNMWLAMKKNDM